MSRSFEIVETFEDALAEYTGAPHVVCVDSCTNALFLALLYHYHEVWSDREDQLEVDVPRHTYAGVPQAVKNAGFQVRWVDLDWVHFYRLAPFDIVDSAKFFERDMYESDVLEGQMVCVSFHIAKRLPLGQGGAILLSDMKAMRWLRRARFDGRTAGETGEAAKQITRPGYHMYMDPVEAARGLWLLEQYVDQPLNPAWHHYPDLSEMM